MQNHARFDSATDEAKFIKKNQWLNQNEKKVATKDKLDIVIG